MRRNRSSCAPTPNAIAGPASRPRWRTRKRRCFPSPTVPSSGSSQSPMRSVTPGLPSPHGARRPRSPHWGSPTAAPGTTAPQAGRGAKSTTRSRAAAPTRLRPRLDLRDRGSGDPLLDRLPLPVERLGLLAELGGLSGIVRKEQLEGGLRTAQPAGRVDPRREAEADRALVAGGGIDACDAHQRPQADLLRLRKAAQADLRECPVLVEERNYVRDRRDRH